MVKRLASSILTLASLSTAALAADGPYIAQPVTLKAEAQEVTTESVIWSCTSTGCATVFSLDNASPAGACRELKREVGPLASFSTGKARFTPQQLAACNGQPVQKTASAH